MACLALDALFGMLEILEEHVLGSAQADALRAHFAGHAGIAAAYRHWCARRVFAILSAHFNKVS